jgi:hypothetical protein
VARSVRYGNLKRQKCPETLKGASDGLVPLLEGHRMQWSMAWMCDFVYTVLRLVTLGAAGDGNGGGSSSLALKPAH